MKIKYLGHSCFAFSDGSATVVTDPYEGIGYELPRGISADAVTVSHFHHDHCNVKAVGVAPVVFDAEGDFKVGNFRLHSFSCFHDAERGRRRGSNLVFSFEAEGLRLVHLGDVGEPVSSNVLSKIGKADVLFLPVGGYYTIDGFEAKRYVDEIKPHIVIPMHFKTPRLNLPIAGADEFASLFQEEEIVRTGGEIELFKTEISGNQLKIIIMERLKEWKTN